ncbi:hypothetical protein DUI87_30665 [Hirundo rustica rustica]|uniref:ribonuclease H n=1 Tax=Hirundo rustica rustica TaxID=333673 RepID=A0A3M0JDY4_HIRRU|nr:hypothetical protein DUI87_30665 [Hirundo rustica rustica]
MACCPSTMPGCLAGTAGVGPHWHSFIQCLQELTGALSRAHGIEHMLLNFHSLVWDALGQAQINGAEASEQDSEARGLLSLFERELLRLGGAQGPALHAFRATQFRSFMRQLNRYGFRKVLGRAGAAALGNAGAWHYYKNPWFRRDRPTSCSVSAAPGTSAPHAPAGSAGCAASTAFSSAQNAPAQEESPVLDLGLEIEKMIWEIRNSLPVKAPSAQGNINVAPESPREDPMNRAAAEEVSSGTESCGNSSPEPEEPEIWERIAKGYQSDPTGVAKKMKFMIKQHSPDWADLQLLLDALTETEKQLVLKVAGDLAEDDCRTTQEDVKDVFPLQDPGWDPNDDEGLGRLKRYQELIVKGLERAIPKTINWSALYAIKQGPSQTPSEFLDHLRDAMHRHTTLDPGSDEGTQQLINLFLGQSTGDIRRKLQKIRGPNSRNLETLLDEAWRVFSNREEGYKQGMKKLAAVVKEGEKENMARSTKTRTTPTRKRSMCILDLLEQLGARIIFKNEEISLEVKDQQYVELLSLMLIIKEIEVGYKNSPTIFGEQLTKDLESWEPPPGEGQLLQYVDDLLIATLTQETCVDWTVSLLNFLGLQGYRVSQKKAQMVRQTVIYLGYEVSAGQRTLGQDRKEAICQTPKPQTLKELRTFLGMTGWCRLWIYNYGLLVKPLYALIMEGSRDLQWTKEATRAFDQLKKALMSAPALGLPNVSKPFFLFSHEKQGIALGILAQNLGLYQRAVAYLSKQLDTAAKGWPGCIRAVAAVAINIQEARKFLARR